MSLLFKVPPKLDDVEVMNDGILVAMIEEPERTVGGVLIHPYQQKRHRLGIVLKVGKGRVATDKTRVAPPVKEMDIVLYDVDYIQEIKINGGHYMLFTEDNGLVGKVGYVDTDGKKVIHAEVTL